MTDLIFYTSGDGYRVIGTDCCLMSGERMRIGGNGELGIRDTNEPVEQYKFQTKGVAAICADIFNRDLARNTQSLLLCANTVYNNTIYESKWTYFKLGTRELVQIDKSGTVIKLDLPYIVWCWLRTTPLVRGAKALWKGWA